MPGAEAAWPFRRRRWKSFTVTEGRTTQLTPTNDKASLEPLHQGREGGIQVRKVRDLLSLPYGGPPTRRRY